MSMAPTESTTFASWHVVQEVPHNATSIPIGRPVANTQLYILDPHLQPVPVGVPGELCVGGDGLARSYLNRPDLTAEKFIPNRFSAEPGGRLCRTGDLATFRPDGSIVFLGRPDHQVKIRGFRIELGENEAVMSQHPAVREGVVRVWEDESGDRRLVAYYVADQDPIPSIEDLGSFVRAGLPEYMVPSTFVAVTALPLTPTGKVNRQGLPAPERLRSSREGGWVAPRDALEFQLTRIWRRFWASTPSARKWPCSRCLSRLTPALKDPSQVPCRCLRGSFGI
jgi:acyl-CoA synthetase (AMP-forming)/AMP-acid ligase II